MEVIRYFKQIYSGQKALATHITLFSIIGITVILWNNVVSTLGRNLLINLFTVAPSTDIELILSFCFGIFFSALLFGYEHKFINSFLVNEKAELPDINYESFGIFFRVFPLFVLWTIYFIVLYAGGTVLLSFVQISAQAQNPQICYYIFSALMVFLIPFISMILIEFCYNFKYKKEFFNPFTPLKHIANSLGKFLVWILEFILFLILPLFILLAMAEILFSLKSEIHRLIFYLASVCVGVYILTILRYVFLCGLGRIVNK